jgi:hypothetical protein
VTAGLGERGAIHITFTALPMTSAGRFSPLGPVGIGDSVPIQNNSSITTTEVASIVVF